MKLKTILLSVTVIGLMIGACNNASTEKSSSTDSTETPTVKAEQTFNLDTTALVSGATFYQCDMHHDINSDKPGICPKCEMDLTELKKH
ncbi:hypothetical protein LBMAG27_24130 [Bacteroidota bacterium]|nr:hypothetical protein LBMAG27_24130 [Bacteroidota bacterium]